MAEFNAAYLNHVVESWARERSLREANSEDEADDHDWTENSHSPEPEARAREELNIRTFAWDNLPARVPYPGALRNLQGEKCAISHEDFADIRRKVVVRADKALHIFEFAHLKHYFEVAGRAVNPMTRQAIKKHDIFRLNA